MEKLTFEVEKMFRLPQAGALKAFADVTINDQIVIRGARILEGKKGLFVSAPKEQGRDSKWYDIVSFLTADAFEAFSLAVMEHYNKQKVTK